MGSIFSALARGAGLVLGAGVVREAAARLGTETRPVLKSAVRAGLTAADRFEVWAAVAREELEDIVEEARAEQRAAARQGKG
jgi:DNA invertase Pin-like site-specific DNA recombinase